LTHMCLLDGYVKLHIHLGVTSIHTPTILLSYK